MSTEISIRNLELKKIIHELWKNADYSPFYKNDENKPKFDYLLGIKSVKPNGYIEHFCGKVLNITVIPNYILTSGYDLLYGQGKSNEIISNL